MSEIIIKKNENANNNNVITDGYLRDNLHLASQSKLRRDGMSQSSTSRNKPLIMFIGSDKVNGKTTMLNKLFPSQQFYICQNEKATPLHKSSVDLVYLSDLNNVNYHILDVHGKINNPYYEYCTKNFGNRLDCLVSLSTLCDCVILEITQKQLRKTKKVKNFLQKHEKPKDKFTIGSLVSDKYASDIISLYKRIQVTVYPSSIFHHLFKFARGLCE